MPTPWLFLGPEDLHTSIRIRPQGNRHIYQFTEPLHRLRIIKWAVANCGPHKAAVARAQRSGGRSSLSLYKCIIALGFVLLIPQI